MNSKVVDNEKTSLAVYMFKYKQLIEDQNRLLSKNEVLKMQYLDKKRTAKQREQIEKEQADIKTNIEKLIIKQGKILTEMMSALPGDIEINGEKYSLVLNTNTFIKLEDYYTSSEEWLAQCQNKVASAIFYGAYCMINEGIEIYNSTHEDKKELIDETILKKQSLTTLFKPVFKKMLEYNGEEGLMLLS